MDRVWVRNTAISAAIACGAMVVGPGVSGTAVASADLIGIDVDVLGIFGHHKDNKKGSNHRAGAKGKQDGGSAQTGRPGQRGDQKTGNQKTGVGGESSGRKSAGTTEGSTSRAAQSANAPSTLSAGVGVTETSVGVPEAQVSVPSTAGGGGGGGGAAMNGRIGRAPNLAPVPTAPSSRQIVIRAQPPEAPSAQGLSAPEAQPSSVAAPSVPAVAAPVPPAAPPIMIVLPVPPLPEVVPPAPSGGGGVPAAPPSTRHVTVPSAQAPQPAAPAINAIPETFRFGYADYLRASSTTDLVFAVLPGLAGLVLLTAAGGAVGFRQARASRTLPAPQIARFLP